MTVVIKKTGRNTYTHNPIPKEKVSPDWTIIFVLTVVMEIVEGFGSVRAISLFTLVDMAADEFRIMEYVIFFSGWYGGRQIPHYGIHKKNSLVDMGADEYRITEYVNNYYKFNKRYQLQFYKIYVFFCKILSNFSNHLYHAWSCIVCTKFSKIIFSIFCQYFYISERK